ncbi:MAG: hypothetical protein H6953_15120 [Chromatiaceae bacterium]|nr:hypothetical protein [Chromatiaceae bacterium]MCP5421725.1 hypothetical protein [Chromatiaceae bacterium]
MDIAGIERSLPNGLHDAILSRYEIDYETRTAKLYLEVWVGDLDSEAHEEREKYAAAVLMLQGLRYWAIEPPSKEISLRSGPYASDTGSVENANTHMARELPAAEVGTFRGYFFLYAIEAFAYFCAEEASIEFTP